MTARSKKAVKQRRAQAAAFDVAVGARVRQKRRTAFMTLQGLSTLSGFSESQISRYESGETTIEPATLAKLAEIFACKASDFIDGIEVKK